MLNYFSVFFIGTHGPFLPDDVWDCRSEDVIASVPFPRRLRGPSWWTLPPCYTEQTGPGKTHTHTYRFQRLKPMKPNGSQLFFYLIIFSNSPPNQLQTGKLFPDQVDVWKGRWAIREGLGTCQIYPGAVGVVEEEEGCRGKQSLGLPMESPWWEQERWKSLCLPICPGRRPSWANLRAKHWD